MLLNYFYAPLKYVRVINKHVPSKLIYVRYVTSKKKFSFDFFMITNLPFKFWMIYWWHQNSELKILKMKGEILKSTFYFHFKLLLYIYFLHIIYTFIVKENYKMKCSIVSKLTMRLNNARN